MNASTTTVADPLMEQRQHDRAAALARHRDETLGHYTAAQKGAIRRLYDHVKEHPGTSGSNTCAKLLLGLYNGQRFPFDLTDLRSLDASLFEAAMTVIRMDARQTWCEAHVLLDAIFSDGRSTGREFEHWAFHMKWGKRCKREDLPEPVMGVQR